MFNRKVNNELNDLWDSLEDTVSLLGKVISLVNKQGNYIHQLEHYINDVVADVANLEEAVFEDDDEACDC